MTHQYVETFSDYTAVLLRSDDEPGKEDRWITRCFMTCGFTEHDHQDEMVFVHTESGVLIACDGDALAIYPVEEPQSLLKCYSDLFMVMRNMDWKKAEVHTMADADDLIAEMAAFIPATYDLSLESVSSSSQQGLVASLRSDIEAQHAAQLDGHAEGGEPVVMMSELLPNSSPTAPSSEPVAAVQVAGLPAQHAPANLASAPAEIHEQVSATPRVPFAARQTAPAATGSGQDRELLLALAHGQNAMLQQFTSLMGLLGHVLPRQQPLEGVTASEGNKEAAVDADLEPVSAPAPVGEAPMASLSPEIGRIPTLPDDENFDEPRMASGAAIGRVPVHPDLKDQDDPPESLSPAAHLYEDPPADYANGSARNPVETQAPAVPIALGTPASTSLQAEDKRGARQFAVEADNLTPEQEQLITSLLSFVHVSLSQVFSIRNELDALRGGTT